MGFRDVTLTFIWLRDSTNIWRSNSMTQRNLDNIISSRVFLTTDVIQREAQRYVVIFDC